MKSFSSLRKQFHLWSKNKYGHIDTHIEREGGIQSLLFELQDKFVRFLEPDIESVSRKEWMEIFLASDLRVRNAFPRNLWSRRVQFGEKKSAKTAAIKFGRNPVTTWLR